jgi:hypothetical protein
MRHLKTILTFLFLILILTSCGSLVQDVNPDRLPKSDVKLVVHGYLSPQDTVLAVKVEKSKTLFGTTQIVVSPTDTYNDGSVVKDATVTLTDGVKTVNLPLSLNAFGEYRISAKALPIVVGKTYSLKVTTPDGLLAESSCTIPAQVPIKEVKRDSVASRYGSNSFTKTVRLFWQDPADKGNYYRVQGGVNTKYTTPAQGTIPEQKYNYWNQIYFGNQGNGSYFVSDEANNGTLMASSQGQLYSGYYGGSSTTTGQTIKTIVYLISGDKNYYNYHQAISNFSDNPFSEPSLTPSNIVGGFGCFAGFNASEVVLK